MFSLKDIKSRLWLFWAIINVFVCPEMLRATEVEPDEATLKNGEKTFSICRDCHTIEQGGKHIYGPNLYAIFGRPVAAMPDFKYSEAIKSMGGVWTADRLNRYIARPKLARPGNKMHYAGLMSPHARADLISWLRTNPAQHKAPADSIDVLVIKTPPENAHRIVARCLVCHEIAEGTGHKIGPNLWGVVGRPVASAPNFNYSEALLRRGGTWTPQTLDIFFTEKKQFEQGSHLAFRELRTREARAAVISWLKTKTSE